MSKAEILLENGEIFYADANLKNKTILGELVFNTAMTGYQEIMTDASYASQIVLMTYPLIGNYGISEEFKESEKIQVSAFITKEISENLSDFLTKKDILCLNNTDTRKITKVIRSQGSPKCLITTEKITEKHKKMLSDYVLPTDTVKKVSCKEIEVHKTEKKKIADIALIDYGAKRNIIRELCQAGADVTVYPYDTPAKIIAEKNHDAIILSNGPGNPKDINTDNIKELIGKTQIFGICLGLQILALVLGADTYKMKFGHHGTNHPVLNTKTKNIMITSQNHVYAVDGKTLPKNADITYININDDTIEGFEDKQNKIKCVQFHPEAAPGSLDAENMITEWIKSVSREKSYA